MTDIATAKDPHVDKRDLVDMEKVLEIYATKSARAAAAYAEVAVRTVQRWAAEEGVRSGFKPQWSVPCPSPAAYMRGCRCDGCEEAEREYQKAVKDARVKRYRAGEAEPEHGVSGYSNWDCRCSVCRTAWSAYLRERRAARKAKLQPKK